MTNEGLSHCPMVDRGLSYCPLMKEQSAHFSLMRGYPTRSLLAVGCWISPRLRLQSCLAG